MLTPSIKYILKSFLEHNIKPILIFSGYLFFNFYFLIRRNKIDYDLNNLYLISFYDGLLIIIIAPIFIFWILDILSFYDDVKLLLKFHLLKDWWKEKLITLLILILLYDLLFNFIFILVILINGLIPYFNFHFIVFFLFGILFQIIGFLILGYIYLNLKYLFSNKLLPIILTYIILLIPYFINGLFYKKIYSLLDYMFLKNLSEYSYFHNLITLILILTFLILVNIYILKKKDINWRN